MTYFFLNYNLIRLIKNNSKATIPEGKSFQESPDGFICLDCAKVTNQGHKGQFYAKDDPKEAPSTSSSDAHPVYFKIKIFKILACSNKIRLKFPFFRTLRLINLVKTELIRIN